MRDLRRRIWYLWNRRRLEREMAYHRELTPADSRDFGSELRLREDARETWGWAWLDRLRQDLLYGIRVLRNSPGFRVTAKLVLALGIGVPLTAFRAVLADLQGGQWPTSCEAEFPQWRCSTTSRWRAVLPTKRKF